MTLLDTPEGQKAVEALTTLWPKGNPSAIEATALLTAALPHLRRALAEELRAKATGFLNLAVNEDEEAHRNRLGTCARVWDDAADFVEGA